MPFPPLPLYPSPTSRRTIATAEWQTYISACVSICRTYLQLSPHDFESEIESSGSLIDFINSYVTQCAAREVRSSNAPEKQLRQQCFLLTHRIWRSFTTVPEGMVAPDFFQSFCIAYAKVPALSALVDGTWTRLKLDDSNPFSKQKNALISLLELIDGKVLFEGDDALRRVSALLRCSISYGNFLMVGSDFLDTLRGSWLKANADCRRKITALAYLALKSLMESAGQRMSLLIDHLYVLRADVEGSNPGQSLLLDLLSHTPFLQKFQAACRRHGSGRAESTLHFLQGLRYTPYRPKPPSRPRTAKGKGKHVFGVDSDAASGLHIHRETLIVQIQDLFPELGSKFVVKLLDYYGDDVEQVTAHLLDGSLPPPLEYADRAENMDDFESRESAPGKILVPDYPFPLLESRRNIFDNDELDRLNVATGKLHIGRKESDVASAAPDKASILAALATFDSDDDERDDTYDAEDVGGTIDNVMLGSDEADTDLRDKKEEILFAAWKRSPQLLRRDAETRRSKARGVLKSETGLGDEAIEGWAIMLSREPGRMRQLEAKFSTFKGEQEHIAATSWREGDDSDADGLFVSRQGPRNRGGRGGRGRGPRSGGGGRGGNVTGPASESSTRAARQRKDVNKGSRANHNRRDQRARKTARAGFPG